MFIIITFILGIFLFFFILMKIFIFYLEKTNMRRLEKKGVNATDSKVKLKRSLQAFFLSQEKKFFFVCSFGGVANS